MGAAAGAAAQNGSASPLSGGRTTLCGTFMAEQTHSNPPAYTLLSLNGFVGARQQRPDALNGSFGVKAARRMRVDKGGAKSSALPALEPTLTSIGSQESSPSGAPRRKGAAKTKPREVKPSARSDARAEQGQADGGRYIAALSDPADAVFDRLYSTQRAHNQSKTHQVAMQTDDWLLSWLAKRSGDPAIATPNASRVLSSGPSVQSTGSRRPPRKYRTTEELFDSCLHRTVSPGRGGALSRESSPNLKPDSRGIGAGGGGPFRNGVGAPGSRASSRASPRLENQSRPGTRQGASPVESTGGDEASVLWAEQKRLSDRVEAIRRGDEIVVLPEDPVEAVLGSGRCHGE